MDKEIPGKLVTRTNGSMEFKPDKPQPKDDNNSGCFIAIAMTAGLYFIILLLLCLVYSVSNLVSFATIKKYDASLYFSNIWHSNHISTKKLLNTFTIYELSYNDNHVNVNDSLKVFKNQNLKFMGYKTVSGTTWIAIEIPLNDIKLRGYIKLPYKFKHDVLKINDNKEYWVGISGDHISYDIIYEDIKPPQVKRLQPKPAHIIEMQDKEVRDTVNSNITIPTDTL